VVAGDVLLNKKTEEELNAFKSFNSYKCIGEPEDIIMAVEAAIAGC